MKRQLMRFASILAAILMSVLVPAPGAHSGFLNAAASVAEVRTEPGELTSQQGTEEKSITVTMKVTCEDKEIKDKEFSVTLEKDYEYVDCRKPPSPRREPPGREDISDCSECKWNSNTRKVSVKCHCKKHPDCSRETGDRRSVSSLDMIVTVIVKKTSEKSSDETPASPRKP